MDTNLVENRGGGEGWTLGVGRLTMSTGRSRVFLGSANSGGAEFSRVESRGRRMGEKELIPWDVTVSWHRPLATGVEKRRKKGEMVHRSEVQPNWKK